jgi:hypothetical protein
MKAAKCDKCGAFFDSMGSHPSCAGWAIGGQLRAGWYPKGLDLCQDCTKSLVQVLAAWWQAKVSEP